MTENSLPDFSGKTVLFFGASGTRTGATGTVLESCSFKEMSGRLFVAGRLVGFGISGWCSGTDGAVAWDLVVRYIVFNSNEDLFHRMRIAGRSWKDFFRGRAAREPHASSRGVREHPPVTTLDRDGDNVPDFAGKIVLLSYGEYQGESHAGILLEQASFQQFDGSQFIIGRVPATSGSTWAAGVEHSVAWDAVLHFMIFESRADYNLREKLGQPWWNRIWYKSSRESGSQAPPEKNVNGGLPDFTGKVVMTTLKNAPQSFDAAALTTDVTFRRTDGHLMTVGRVPSNAEYGWYSSLETVIAWDKVLDFLIFDSAEDYLLRTRRFRPWWRRLRG